MSVSEEENYEEACQAHPREFQDISSATNQIGEEWNPRLHLLLHSIVLGQMEEMDEVRETYEELTDKHNLHPHSAIHALGSVLSEEIYDMLDERREFDPEGHAEELNNLLNRNSVEYRKYVLPLKHGKPPEHQDIR
ncbi:MAG: DUF1841 family protein [Candidatus Bipolaricaulota bacterium]